MKNTAASKRVGRMFGLDLHGWELIVAVLLGIGAIAAVALVVSTQIVIKLQRLDAKEKADAFAQYKIEVGKQTDQLKKDTAEATARALEAQLAVEKFKAPRTLTPKQRGRIVNKLKQFVATDTTLP